MAKWSARGIYYCNLCHATGRGEVNPEASEETVRGTLVAMHNRDSRRCRGGALTVNVVNQGDPTWEVL